MPDERIEKMMERPVDRRMLVRWLMMFHTESVEELRDSLLRRLDDGAFAPSSNPIFNVGKWREICLEKPELNHT